MMTSTLAVITIHEDRIRDAHDQRRNAELARLRKQGRAEARARRRRLRSMRKDAHRATLGAFIAFGDGVAGTRSKRANMAPPTDAGRSGARATHR